MTSMKWPIAFTLLTATCIYSPLSRANEASAQPPPNAGANLIANGSFSQWRQLEGEAPSAGFVQNAPVGWISRTHALTLNEGKKGTKQTDYTYRRDESAAGVQPITPSTKSLIVRVQNPDFAYRIFQEFVIEPGTYVFSGGLGVSGHTSPFPMNSEQKGSPVPWKIALELLDSEGKRVSLTTLATALPVAADALPGATKFKPVTVTVPAGVAKASFSIWCYGGNAYGHIDDLVLAKVTPPPAPTPAR